MRVIQGETNSVRGILGALRSRTTALTDVEDGLHVLVSTCCLKKAGYKKHMAGSPVPRERGTCGKHLQKTRFPGVPRGWWPPHPEASRHLCGLVSLGSGAPAPDLRWRLEREGERAGGERTSRAWRGQGRGRGRGGGSQDGWRVPSPQGSLARASQRDTLPSTVPDSGDASAFLSPKQRILEPRPHLLGGRFRPRPSREKEDPLIPRDCPFSGGRTLSRERFKKPQKG